LIPDAEPLPDFLDLVPIGITLRQLYTPCFEANVPITSALSRLTQRLDAERLGARSTRH
jgi:hypothetical protein